MDENSQRDVKQVVIDKLDSAVCELFSSRDNTDEAFEYAMSLARRDGMPTGVMATALMVYHNTLVQQLIKDIKENV